MHFHSDVSKTVLKKPVVVEISLRVPLKERKSKGLQNNKYHTVVV